jgi:Asp-tRNA(Asn)/Glu-tRNA(Gln) amidotransferase A subunit family amidase
VPDLHELTATQARDAIARGETTSEALVKACLGRVAKRDKDVGAWAYLDPEQALRQARAADEAKRSGSAIGPLHGVPVGIKDIIDTADMPTQNGSVYFEGRQPAEDATCVAALRAAGAVIMGKTVTTELATLTPAKTRNPHNPEHTPGGSSSGSAAGVASGMIPAALATQTGGSVIRPASFCGIYALKPTLGLISRSGVLLQSHTLDTVGVYGRSIEDLALLTDCLAAHDPKDPASFPRSPSRLLDVARSMPPAKPRLAFVRSPAWAEADEAARATFTDFVERLGDHCETVELPVLGPVIAAHRIVQSSENAAYYGPLIERDRDSFSAGLIERLEAGQRITARAYIEAIMLREGAATSVEQVLARYTAILMPAAPGPAPASLGTTGNPVFNGMWTYLGMPAVTLPLLSVGGLPFGVQLIGARRDEGRLLRTARWLVQHASTIGSRFEPRGSQRL